MRIISISNQKGGCGKTTTAVNLAASLAQNGKRILLIDLDPQAHATSGLNINNELSVYNVLSKITNKKARFEDIIVKVSNLFDLAPSNMLLGTLEQELADEIGRESRLFDCLKKVTHGYDYVLIDCPPNLGILTINAIRASEKIIIPVEASRFSLEGLNHLIKIINLVNERLEHNVTFSVLVTIFDSRLRHSFQMLNRIRSQFKKSMFNTIVHTNVKLKESQAEGKHIFDYDKYSRGAKDYFSLSREIISIEESAGQGIREKDAAEETLLAKPRKATFLLHAPEAKAVNVVGDFNNWLIDDNSKLFKRGDVWERNFYIKPGNYKYRFVVDGKRWLEDPKNPQTLVNPFGELDSILEHE